MLYWAIEYLRPEFAPNCSRSINSSTLSGEIFVGRNYQKMAKTKTVSLHSRGTIAFMVKSLMSAGRTRSDLATIQISWTNIDNSMTYAIKPRKSSILALCREEVTWQLPRTARAIKFLLKISKKNYNNKVKNHIHIICLFFHEKILQQVPLTVRLK